MAKSVTELKEEVKRLKKQLEKEVRTPVGTSFIIFTV